MAIQKVGVVGCGLMGSGIAQVCAAAGFPTVVREVSAELVDKGLKGIEKNLNRLVEKGTITGAARSEIRARLNGTTSLEDLKNSDLIVEAIIEQLPAKRDRKSTRLNSSHGYISYAGFCLKKKIKTLGQQ